MITFKSDRLNFRLQDFVRTTWVSDQAKTVWDIRLNQVIHAWDTTAYLMALQSPDTVVLHTIAPMNLLALSGRLKNDGLIAEVLEVCGLSQSFSSTVAPALIQSKPYNYQIVIGFPEKVKAFRNIWNESKQQAFLERSHYPKCCMDFWNQEINQFILDSTWPIASNTCQGDHPSLICEIKGVPQANILLRWLGIHLAAHSPCQFNCAATINQVNQWINLSRKNKFEVEMDWLLEMLSWPVEWTALHGIAEIKTPVVKIASTTDATGSKYTVHLLGTSYPPEGASGVVFPYKQPVRKRVTGSKGYERGLNNPIEDLSEIEQ